MAKQVKKAAPKNAPRKPEQWPWIGHPSILSTKANPAVERMHKILERRDWFPACIQYLRQSAARQHRKRLASQRVLVHARPISAATVLRVSFHCPCCGELIGVDKDLMAPGFFTLTCTCRAMYRVDSLLCEAKLWRRYRKKPGRPTNEERKRRGRVVGVQGEIS